MADQEKRSVPTVSAGYNQEGPCNLAKPEVEGYSIIEQLGVGGMGSVWKAEQQSTRRIVALKIIGSQYFGAERAQARFVREVEIAARLEHPGIARIYDSGLRRGVYYYAMEFIDGKPLDEYVRQNGLEQKGILHLFCDICLAVEYAHRKGIVHRDLKPSNIFVTPDGGPHILDFGLAKDLLTVEGNRTVSLGGEVLGTPAYMSPEQAAGRLDEVDTRTDVYSLSVILFCLLTGTWPYDVTGAYYEVLKNVQEQEPQRPSRLVPAFDTDIEAILLKGLAKAPGERYQSVADLARDMCNSLENLPISVRSIDSIYLFRKFISRHRAASAIAALLLATIAGTASISTYSAYNTDRANERLQKSIQRREAERESLLRLMQQGAYSGLVSLHGAPNGTLTRTDLAASEKDKCFSAFVVGEYCLMHGLSWEAKMAFEWCAQTARDANEPPWWFQEKAAQRLNGMTVDNRSLQ